VPEWSPFADADEWRAFAEVVEAETKARGWRLDLEQGLAHAGTTRYTLGNLAQACRNEPRDGWAARVHRHFDTVAGIDSERRFSSAAEAHAALKARLVDHGFFAQATFEPVWRPVADDLRLALAFDLPQSVVIADRAEVLEWGEEDELFAVALENARAEAGLELERHPLDDSAAVWALSGDSFFTATHALWADGFDPPPSEHGTLVAVPTRHIVLAHAIRHAGAIHALMLMLDMAGRIHAEGPGSLSDRVYWLRDGSLTRIDARIDGANVHLAPSEEFEAMLERLD
jgi:hypothetical protein